MAKLIREDGGGHRQVRRPDGRTEQFARAPRWRIRYGLFYPDGSRAIRSKMTGRRSDATLLRSEASRLERLTRTATATQQDLGHFLRMGLISQDDYVRLGGANLNLSWDEVLAAYVDSSYGRCRLFTHQNNAAERIQLLRISLPIGGSPCGYREPHLGASVGIIMAVSSLTGATAQVNGVRNVLLVHGAFADGSSWSKIIPLLQAKGLHVVAV